MPCLADAIERFQPSCLQQHPWVPGAPAPACLGVLLSAVRVVGSVCQAGCWQGWHGALLFGCRDTG